MTDIYRRDLALMESNNEQDYEIYMFKTFERFYEMVQKGQELSPLSINFDKEEREFS